MTSKTKKRLLILIIVVVIIVAILWVLYYMGLTPAAPTSPLITSPPAEEQVDLPPIEQEEIVVQPDLPPTQLSPNDTFSEAVRTGRVFAERFGSFSTEADWENVVDLYPIMTDTVRQWLDKMVEEDRANRGDEIEYFAINTKVLNYEVIEEGDLEAVIVYTTQRHQQGNQQEDKIYYQDIEITLVKVDGVWKVDKAYWQD